jgi:hypothetical protein
MMVHRLFALLIIFRSNFPPALLPLGVKNQARFVAHIKLLQSHIPFFTIFRACQEVHTPASIDITVESRNSADHPLASGLITSMAIPEYI